MVIRRYIAVGTALVTLGLGLGCQSPGKSYKASDCALGKGGDCGIPGVVVGAGTGTGGTGGEGGGQGGAPAQAVDVNGTVAVVDTTTFDHLGVYTKKVTVVAPTLGGTVEGSTDGSSAGFSLKGVATGNQWFFARDDSGGGAGVLSTYSAHRVPSSSPLVVPVMDLQVLQTIAATQPSAITIDGLAAQVVLLLRRQGSPASGLTLTSSAFGGTVAYDQSAGVYSSAGAKKTGGSGVIVMLNVGAPVAGKDLDILLTDEANETYAFSIPVAAGAATIALYEY
ncbi:MAG: hypothetical protein U0359_17340 [Byssovorax sp.]